MGVQYQKKEHSRVAIFIDFFNQLFLLELLSLLKATVYLLNQILWINNRYDF